MKKYFKALAGIGAGFIFLLGAAPSLGSDFEQFESHVDFDRMAKSLIIRSMSGDGECAVDLNLQDKDIRIAIDKQKGIKGVHFSKHHSGDFLKYDVRYEVDAPGGEITGVFIFTTGYFADDVDQDDNWEYAIGEFHNKYGKGGLLKADPSLAQSCGKYHTTSRSGFWKVIDGLGVGSTELRHFPLLGDEGYKKEVQSAQYLLNYMSPGDVKFTGQNTGRFDTATANALTELANLPRVKPDEKDMFLLASEGPDGFNENLYDLIYEIYKRPK